MQLHDMIATDTERAANIHHYRTKLSKWTNSKQQCILLPVTSQVTSKTKVPKLHQNDWENKPPVTSLQTHHSTLSSSGSVFLISFFIWVEGKMDLSWVFSMFDKSCVTVLIWDALHFLKKKWRSLLEMILKKTNFNLVGWNLNNVCNSSL